MKLVDVTFTTPEENLALDEALLDLAETSHEPQEFLRLWESPTPVVVLGRSSSVTAEVDIVRCRRRGVPILRRTSGGATIVAGPGCLMYAVVLSSAVRPQLASLAGAHDVALNTLVAALSRVAPNVRRAGTSDLAVGNRKFSGNSLRVKRGHVLYHGTLLYNFPLETIGELLLAPPRTPEYRAGRSHGEFVANLPVSAEELRWAMIHAWQANAATFDIAEVETSVAELVVEKYSRDAWNFAL